VSALAKFSVYTIIFWLSYGNLKAEVAPWISLGIVIIVITASLIASFIYKRRGKTRGEPARSP
jgi:uncharacterized membrane protein YeiB